LGETVTSAAADVSLDNLPADTTQALNDLKLQIKGNDGGETNE